MEARFCSLRSTYLTKGFLVRPLLVNYNLLQVVQETVLHCSASTIFGHAKP